jgi:hypothetical protein
MPLVAERLVYNIATLQNSFANVAPKRWYVHPPVLLPEADMSKRQASSVSPASR